MKKFLILLCALSYIQMGYAADTQTANIKIKISGALNDNRYFLCLPNIGCLSILAAQKGKVYPIFHSIQMDNFFVTNMNSFRVTPQGRPDSCNVTVNTNQTLTIYGKLIPGPDDTVHVDKLRCVVT